MLQITLHVFEQLHLFCSGFCSGSHALERSYLSMSREKAHGILISWDDYSLSSSSLSLFLSSTDQKRQYEAGPEHAIGLLHSYL